MPEKMLANARRCTCGTPSIIERTDDTRLFCAKCWNYLGDTFENNLDLSEIQIADCDCIVCEYAREKYGTVE